MPPEESSSSRHFQKSIRLRERESERNRQKEFQKVSTVVVQYKKKGRTPTNERTTNEIPFNTSAGARAMHGFGAEVCVEEVQ